MNAVNPEFVERYQLEYQKNPKSKVFAPLAEAYRKMGLIDEAYQVCKRGVMIHPDFASGRVAFAKILLEKKALPEALEQLGKAVSLSPENLLAHSLMGETLIEMRRPKEALKAFKMVLFLNPGDERARKAVQKWEFLTAEEYNEDVFAMKPLFRPETQELLPPIGDEKSDSRTRPTFAPGTLPPNRGLERALSLADAFTVRGDLDAAAELIEAAIRQFGAHPDLDNRLRLLSRRAHHQEADEEEEEVEDAEIADETSDEEGLTDEFKSVRATSTQSLMAMAPADPTRDVRERKRQKLESFLRRINERRSPNR